MKNKIHRRKFCQTTLYSSVAMALPGTSLLFEQPDQNNIEYKKGPKLIDTFIHLFEWPFRDLNYSNTRKLVEKLQSHSIDEAWAGNFEALLHKDIDRTNRRLVEECRRTKRINLKPVGSVNTNWPDWEEDLRRCDEEYHMAGIRIHPVYQMIPLHSQEFRNLVAKATQRNMFVQVAGDLEDPRHHHPLIKVHDISFEPLLDVAKSVPNARIQLVHWNRKVRGDLFRQLVEQTNVLFDTSRIEGAGELGGLIAGNSWYGPDQKIAAERFLFGSHAPFFAVESALMKLFEHPLSEESLYKVMKDNAKHFYSV